MHVEMLAHEHEHRARYGAVRAHAHAQCAMKTHIRFALYSECARQADGGDGDRTKFINTATRCDPLRALTWAVVVVVVGACAGRPLCVCVSLAACVVTRIAHALRAFCNAYNA